MGHVACWGFRSMPELSIAGLSKSYGDFCAVDQVDLEVRDGEFFTLLGPSGCGKSTTLACVAGLEVPSAGRIALGSTVFSDGSSKFLPPEQRGCGLVFQTYALWPHMTVGRNLEFPLKLRRNRQLDPTLRTAEGRRRRVNEMLEMVELAGLQDRYPHELSGGQQQRVGLARAIVAAPDLLLLDEPLSNLDAKLREKARHWIRHLQQEVGVTTVYVTHDQDEALSLSDRIAVMLNGQIMQCGTPEEIYRFPASLFVATFIGKANLVRCRLKEIQPDSLVVEILGADRCLVVPRENLVGISNVGDEVVASVRPEMISVGSTDGSAVGSNSFTGVVADVSYLGDRFEYEVMVSSVPFTLSSPLPIAVGETNLRIDSAGVRLFPPSPIDPPAIEAIDADSLDR